jgi:hypothetical protein
MSCIEEGLGEEGSKIREDDGKVDLGECNMSVLIQVLKRKDDRSLKMKVRDVAHPTLCQISAKAI